MSHLDPKLLFNSYLWLTPAPFPRFTNSFTKFPQRRAHTHCIISPSIHSYSHLVRAFLGLYTYEVGCRPQPAVGLIQFDDLANLSTWLQLTCSSYCDPAGSCLQDKKDARVQGKSREGPGRRLCSVLTCRVPVLPLLLSPTVTCHFCWQLSTSPPCAPLYLM